MDLILPIISNNSSLIFPIGYNYFVDYEPEKDCFIINTKNGKKTEITSLIKNKNFNEIFFLENKLNINIKDTSVGLCIYGEIMYLVQQISTPGGTTTIANQTKSIINNRLIIEKYSIYELNLIQEFTIKFDTIENYSIFKHLKKLTFVLQIQYNYLNSEYSNYVIICDMQLLHFDKIPGRIEDIKKNYKNLIPINNMILKECYLYDLDLHKYKKYYGTLNSNYNEIDKNIYFCNFESKPCQILLSKSNKNYDDHLNFTICKINDNILINASSDDKTEEYEKELIYQDYNFKFISSCELLYEMLEDAINNKSKNLIFTYIKNDKELIMKIDIKIQYFNEQLKFILIRKEFDKLLILEKKVNHIIQNINL